MECKYCHLEIKDKAINLHLKLCPKRPKDGESTVQQLGDGLVKLQVRPDVIDKIRSMAQHVKPMPPKTEAEIPKVGTAEYMEYWQQLTTRGQQHELARRKALGEQVEAIESVVKGLIGTTATTPDTKAEVTTSGNGAMEVFYPKADPNFLVSENVVEALRVTEAISHKHPTNLLITGQPGGGKTTLALQFAAKFNRPVVVADFGVLQEPQQLFQTTRLIERNGGVVTDTRESGFIRGIETEGCVVVMDEMTRVENERVLNPLMPLLDMRGSAWIDDLRRRIHVANNVIFVATINEGALFCGISSLDLALRDRFREIFLDYLPAEPESRVLQEKAGVPKTIANSLAEFAYVVRTTPAISRKVSTRQLLHAAEAFAEGTSLWQAVETAIGNYQDLAWRQQVMEIFSLNIKDEAEYKKWTNKPRSDRYVRY